MLDWLIFEHAAIGTDIAESMGISQMGMRQPFFSRSQSPSIDRVRFFAQRHSAYFRAPRLVLGL